NTSSPLTTPRPPHTEISSPLQTDTRRSFSALVPSSSPQARGIAQGGMGQPARNPTTGTFFVSIPQFAGSNNPGGVSEISTAGLVLRTIDFANLGITSCSPTGLAVGGGGKMMVGCGNVGTQAVLLNSNRSLITTIPGLGSTDELWYDPTT